MGRNAVLFSPSKKHALSGQALSNQTTDPRAHKRTVTVKVKRERSIPIGDNDMNLSFVSCATDKVADNDNVKSRLYRIGTYSYETRLGTMHTIPLFTNSFEAFCKYTSKNN